MGYEIDKRLVYKKHNFEEYLNSKESDEWWDKLDEELKKYVNSYPSSKFRNKIGTVFRHYLKEDFAREYLIWLNTK